MNAYYVFYFWKQDGLPGGYTNCITMFAPDPYTAKAAADSHIKENLKAANVLPTKDLIIVGAELIPKSTWSKKFY